VRPGCTPAAGRLPVCVILQQSPHAAWVAQWGQVRRRIFVFGPPSAEAPKPFVSLGRKLRSKWSPSSGRTPSRASLSSLATPFTRSGGPRFSIATVAFFTSSICMSACLAACLSGCQSVTQSFLPFRQSIRLCPSVSASVTLVHPILCPHCEMLCFWHVESVCYQFVRPNAIVYRLYLCSAVSAVITCPGAASACALSVRLSDLSPHQDLAFLRRRMPRVAEHLHYRIVDVSTLAILCRAWYRRDFDRAPQKVCACRALCADGMSQFQVRSSSWYRSTPCGQGRAAAPLK
jgi:hypothetical protein